ncbi:DUF401 family protein [candidate division WOR-3 bacterium]|nr:DUF401 family protein [candidate division WOR-3 bacterium]
MNLIIWLGFLLSLTTIILVSRKSLWLGLIIGSILLGLFNLSPIEIGRVIIETIRDPSILLLALSVGIIPLIGGIMEESHLMEWLVNNLRVGKKGFLMLSPALFGMLPMPGGALLSAPMVEKAGNDIEGDRKAAINVWFRHLLIFVYPLGALLPTTKMAGLNVYKELMYLVPYFFIIFVLGYYFLIRDIKGGINYRGNFDIKGLTIPLIIILLAPIIHFIFMGAFSIEEIPLIIGVLVSLILAFVFSRMKMGKFLSVVKKMKPWNYAMIIIGMFLFLNIFKASDMSKVIADIAFSPSFLLIGIGFLLGFATGRIQVPVSILLPIFYSKFGTAAMTPTTFAIMFFAVFMGYMISPIHPCVSVSIAFFNTSIKDFLKILILPVIISLIIMTISAFIQF